MARRTTPRNRRAAERARRAIPRRQSVTANPLKALERDAKPGMTATSSNGRGQDQARKARSLRASIDPTGANQKSGITKVTPRLSNSPTLNKRRKSDTKLFKSAMKDVDVIESRASLPKKVASFVSLKTKADRAIARQGLRKVKDRVSPVKFTGNASGKLSRMARGVSARDKLEANFNRAKQNTAVRASRKFRKLETPASKKYKSARKGFDKFSDEAISKFGSFRKSGLDSFNAFVKKADKKIDKAADAVEGQVEKTQEQLAAALKNLKKAWAANRKDN